MSFGKKCQVYTTKKIPKSFDYQDFIPVVDKTMDASWQKMVDNERFTPSKGMFVLLELRTYACFQYLLLYGLQACNC